MKPVHNIPILFTPGPLTTSATVKAAMHNDLGSRDATFIAIVEDIRQRLLMLAELDDQAYTTILMQGAGTFAIEAMLASVVPANGKLLIIINGAYGRRMRTIAKLHNIPTLIYETTEDQPPNPASIAQLLANDNAISHVAIVHCETTTGILNPLHEIGHIVKQFDRTLLVDAMSSFGGVPIDFRAAGIDFLVSSANKCIEGVPGFAFVIARKAELEATRHVQRTLSLDLYAQWDVLEHTGQFRFTPPVQVLLAFHQALLELETEGGMMARATRYQTNHTFLMHNMSQLGFEPYLNEYVQSPIITTFYYPDHVHFEFGTFYERLHERGMVIYPGKLSHADCFRIGNIGRIDTSHIKQLVNAIVEVLATMGIDVPLQQKA